jgi:hypothetical protein
MGIFQRENKTGKTGITLTSCVVRALPFKQRKSTEDIVLSVEYHRESVRVTITVIAKVFWVKTIGIASPQKTEMLIAITNVNAPETDRWSGCTLIIARVEELVCLTFWSGCTKSDARGIFLVSILAASNSSITDV